MNVFTEDDQERLDFSILLDGGARAYRKPEGLEADLAWLKNAGYTIHEFNCENWDDFIERLKQVFNDAMDTYLHDLPFALDGLDVPEQGGVVLCLRSVDKLTLPFPEAIQDFLEVTTEHARKISLSGRRLLVLVQADGLDFQLEPVFYDTQLWNAGERFPPAEPLISLKNATQEDVDRFLDNVDDFVRNKKK